MNVWTPCADRFLLLDILVIRDMDLVAVAIGNQIEIPGVNIVAHPRCVVILQRVRRAAKLLHQSIRQKDAEAGWIGIRGIGQRDGADIGVDLCPRLGAVCHWIGQG